MQSSKPQQTYGPAALRHRCSDTIDGTLRRATNETGTMTRLITPTTGLVTATGGYVLYLAATTWSLTMCVIGLGAWAVSATAIVRLEHRRHRPTTVG